MVEAHRGHTLTGHANADNGDGRIRRHIRSRFVMTMNIEPFK